VSHDATEQRSHEAGGFRWSRFAFGFAATLVGIAAVLWVSVVLPSRSVVPWATIVNQTEQPITVQFIETATGQQSLDRVNPMSDLAIYPLDETDAARLFRRGVMLIVADTDGENIRTCSADVLLEPGLASVIVTDQSVVIEHEPFRRTSTANRGSPEVQP